MNLILRYSLVFFSIFLSLNSFSQTTIWEEDFSTYADQTTVGTANRWTLTTTSDVNGTDPNDHFWVVSGELEARDLNGNEQVFQTELINISGFNNVFVKLDAYEVGTQEDSDYINVYYILDGGPETLFASSGSNINDFSDAYSPTRSTQSGLSGSTLSVVVRVQNAASDEYHYIDNIIIGVPADDDGDGTPNNLDQDGDNDGIPNSEDGCSSTDVENTVGFGNNITDTTYILDGTSVTYTHSISEPGAEITGYTGGNLGGALRMTGDDNASDTFFNIDATFSTDIEYLTFKMTDFDSDEEVTVNVYDENNNLYDLTTAGVSLVGSFITQTANTFSGTASNINVDGNNSTEDIYGSVLFYFPGKVSRIDLTGRVSDSASLRITEYNFCINDFDNDGVKDFLDLDSDNDGITDIIEAGGIDSDQNGVTDDITDYNNNGIPDTFDENCTGTTSGIGNADNVVNSNLVTTASNILGPQDLTDAIIAPTGSIIVDLTDSVLPNSLIIIKHRKASGTARIPFSIEQSLNPLSGYTNIYNISTSDTNSHFSFSYRVQTNNARYIRITNTDNDQNLGIDYLGYNFGSLTDCNGTIGASIPLLNSDSDSLSNWVDIDSDNDGIPDNIEGQATTAYIIPNGVSNAMGVDTAYPSGIIPEDTDGDGIYDYLDTDTDGDGILDIAENGDINTLNVIDVDGDGLDDAFDSNTISFDVNDEITVGDVAELVTVFGDADSDVASGGDLDYRDLFDVIQPPSATLDFDGINDYVVGTSIFSKYNQSNTDGVTIMGWIKSDSDNLDTARKFVFGERKSVEVYITDEDIRAYIHCLSSDNSTVTHDVYRTTTGIKRGIWRHVTVTVSFIENKATLLLDGDLVFSTNLFDAVGFESSITAENETFRLGNNSTLSSTGFFKGAIDEIRLFKKVMSEDDIKDIIFQEIENNSGLVGGAILKNTLNSFNWSDIEVYYPMSNISTGVIKDASLNDNSARLFNITTIQEQTAPMPFTTKQDGFWHDKNTWTHGDVWYIPGDEVVEAATFGNDEVVDWGIFHIKNNVTLTTSMSEVAMPLATNGIEALGFIIDETDISNNDITFTIGNASKNLQLNVSKYFELNGTLDLLGDSQLIQSNTSDLVTSAVGKVQRRQEGNTDLFWYNYWTSPVGTLGATTLTDNNTSANNINNTPFSLNMLEQENGANVNFTTAVSPPLTNPVTLSSRWFYNFQNGLDYNDWAEIDETTALIPGMGYTQKGTGAAGLEQQYIFEGKPNNGTILIPADDVDGDFAIESIEGITMTTSLIGNPYPSALDAVEFINDNAGIIQGTILLWEQWAGNSHYLSKYQGGYGYINTMTTARAYQHPDIVIADQTQTQGIKTPTFFIPVGQGFFVEVVNDGDIEFNNSQRVFKQEALNESIFFDPIEADSDKPLTSEEATRNNNPSNIELIRFEFSTSAGATRHFVTGFSDTTSDGFDYGFDGGLITTTPDEDMGIFVDDQHYVLQAFAPITPEKVVDLTFNTSGDYTYSLEVIDIQNIDATQVIYLKDNQENIYWNLRQGAYNFTAFAGQDHERFDLVFQSGETLSDEEFNTNDVLIYVDNKEDKLFIKGMQEQAKSLSITNMIGQQIKSLSNVTVNTLENGIYVSQLATGVYVVKISTNNATQISKKVIIE